MEGDRDGFIVPPPGLVPPRRDADQSTRRAPARRELPPFHATAPGHAPDRPAAARPTWRLILADGTSVSLIGAVVVGRNPEPSGAWADAIPVSITDPTRSLSKTHAALEPLGDRMRIADLHSTNGVTVERADGERSALAPGKVADVGSGVALLLGTLRLRVERDGPSPSD